MKITISILTTFLVLLIPACSHDIIDSGRVQPSTITDIDGNVYQVIKIGEQWWMTENLKVTRYRNGDRIPLIKDSKEWKHTFFGAYAIYPHTRLDGLETNEEVGDKYGLLYNWYAVNNSRGLCPEGWHIPSDADWKKLEMHLGMSQQDANQTGRRGYNQGGQIKSRRTDPDPHPSWRSPNVGATDYAGFSAVPGGFRSYDGSFDDIGRRGVWWSSTKYDDIMVWSRILHFQYGNIFRDISCIDDGLSVRCVSY